MESLGTNCRIKFETDKILYLSSHHRINLFVVARFKVWETQRHFNCDCRLFGTKYGCSKVGL